MYIVSPIDMKKFKQSFVMQTYKHMTEDIDWNTKTPNHCNEIIRTVAITNQ